MNKIDEYINQFPYEIQDKLNKIRKIILDNAPQSEEIMSYGMLGYKLNKKLLVYFAAFKNHIGFYATPSGHSEFQVELSKYKQGKGSVQFPIGEAIPYELIEHKSSILNLINQAIEVEKPGAKIEKKSEREPLPEELLDILDEDIIFKNAFFSLTPGRQRAYIIHFSQPKQSRTRISRIYKYKQMILDGIGINDKYNNSKK